MRRFPALFAAFVTIAAMLHLSGCTPGRPLEVALLTSPRGMTPADSAARDWMQARENIAVHTVTLDELAEGGLEGDALWLHIPDADSWAGWTLSADRAGELLGDYYRGGGRLLLTGFAARMPHLMGVEPRAPTVHSDTLRGESWFFTRKRGLQGFRGHPLFEGMHGGAFLYDPGGETVVDVVGYFDDRWPEAGRVAAVEKRYVHLHPERRLVTEYGDDSTGARMVAVGGFVHLRGENLLAYRMDRFIGNALRYVGGEEPPVEPTFWRNHELVAREFEVQTVPGLPPGKDDPGILEQTGLLFNVDEPGDDWWDVGGRRTLIQGRQRGGIREVWVHPFRILRDWRAGIIVDGELRWLEEFPVTVQIRPESVSRTYGTPFGTLREIIFSSWEKPGGVVHYELESGSEADLVVTFRCDNRWMWPYDQDALGDLYYGYDEGMNALHVRDVSGDFYTVVAGDAQPFETLTLPADTIVWRGGAFAATRDTTLNEVRHAFRYRLGDLIEGTVNLAFAGTNRGGALARETVRDMLAKPLATHNETVRAMNNLLERATTVTTPDEEINRLLRWTILGTDRFWMRTPGIGTALVAGFATTDRGWDGGHQVNGRPGYAWYFGRDAVWSAFAVNAYGDAEMTLQQLRTFERHQDLNGKVFHELPTSGPVHYDAADATPLYVMLAADYLRTTGDTRSIKRSWPHLKRAMDFLISTDTDGDGLIENHDVGHGWVEGGRLWGAKTSLYLAGLWAQCLHDASDLASALNRRDIAAEWRQWGDSVIEQLNTDFYDEQQQFYAFGKNPDDSFEQEKTVMPAPVAAFGLLDEERMEPVLAAYAGNGFSTDWGMRILSADDPDFHPAGYHSGSVWPLYTGWTSLAEYRYGRSTQGFTRILNNLFIKNWWSVGYVEEVMHGLTYTPRGVCPHQCWSETNVLHPLYWGLVGWRPDAPQREADLEPRMPIHWDELTVENLRLGDSRIRLEVERTTNATQYRLALTEGPAVTIRLAPGVPHGQTIGEALLDGRDVDVSPRTHLGLLERPVEIRLRDQSTLELRHSGGVGILPLAPRPSPGDESQGWRIVDESYDGGLYRVVIEGPSGGRRGFPIRLFDNDVMAVEGGRILEFADEATVVVQVRIPSSREPYGRATLSLALQ